jgi:hypothetical protein
VPIFDSPFLLLLLEKHPKSTPSSVKRRRGEEVMVKEVKEHLLMPVSFVLCCCLALRVQLCSLVFLLLLVFVERYWRSSLQN